MRPASPGLKLAELMAKEKLKGATRVIVRPGRYYEGRLKTLDQAHRRWFAKVARCTLAELARHEQTPFMEWYLNEDGTFSACSPHYVWYDDAFRIVEYLRVTII